MNVTKRLAQAVLGPRLPAYSGSVAAQGLVAPVEILRDRYGIPHIQATTDADAWFGLGYAMGQDRAFQIETIARFVRGTTAELVGTSLLPLDLFARRVGFRQVGRRAVERLSEAESHDAQAFVAGINAGIGSLRQVPHEFALLRSTPTTYRVEDVFGYAAVQALALGGNWDLELARLAILQDAGADALVALDPGYPHWLPATSPPGQPVGISTSTAADDANLRWRLASPAGSNAWALAGSKTASGLPLLANDPHLPPSLPNPWYLAHVSAPGWAVAGAVLAGTPAFMVAHNGFAAWGVTAGLADYTDLAFEELSADETSVRRGDAFVPCEIRNEVIRVRGEPAVTERVVITPDGPIVTPLGPFTAPMSLRAHWLDPGRPIRLTTLPKVRSFGDFREVFRDVTGPSLNMVYADSEGTIGWQLVGAVPHRRRGFGSLPDVGWDADAGWEPDPVAYDALPHVVDPPAGFIACANNRPTSEGPFLGADWADGYRVARIAEKLAAHSQWTVRDTASLQLDTKSIPWREMKDSILTSTSGFQSAARRLLVDWDGRVEADSAAATVFEFLVAELVKRVVRRLAPNSDDWALGRTPNPLTARSSFNARRVGHLSRILRDGQGLPDGEIGSALTEAAKRLEAEFGADPRDWEWGRVRPLRLTHPVGRRLGAIFDLGPYPWGGDHNTVAQAGVSIADPKEPPSVIANLRAVFDLSDWERCRFILAGGQSGNPFSPHYGDQVEAWRQGTSVPIPWTDADVRSAGLSTLELRPA